MGIKSRTFDTAAAGTSDVSGAKASRVKLTDKERERLKELIKNASTLEEVTRLERALNEGRIPPGVIG